MPFAPHAALRCPLDELPLTLDDRRLVCANNHSFDIARQGYVNLLGAGDKRSPQPGDSKEMIAARHAFLEAGHYRPLVDALFALLKPHLRPDSLLVDAGCGEGYYLQQLLELLPGESGTVPAIVGFDISKWALQVAARRFAASWLVASNRNIPLENASVDVVLDMFGFPDFGAFARVLKPSGVILRAVAGANHLRELRALIYPELRERTPTREAPTGFYSLQSSNLRYSLPSLRQPAIAQLLLMTPHYFRASASARKRVQALEELQVSVDISLELLRKTSGPGDAQPA